MRPVGAVCSGQRSVMSRSRTVIISRRQLELGDGSFGWKLLAVLAQAVDAAALVHRAQRVGRIGKCLQMTFMNLPELLGKHIDRLAEYVGCA